MLFRRIFLNASYENLSFESIVKFLKLSSVNRIPIWLLGFRAKTMPQIKGKWKAGITGIGLMTSYNAAATPRNRTQHD